MAGMGFGCMVTFEDWTRAFGTWGEIGVRYILCRILEAGFDRVYWRTSGSGQASYPSRVTNAVGAFEPYDPVKYPEHITKLSQPARGEWFPHYVGGWRDRNWYDHAEREGDRQILDMSLFDGVSMARDFAHSQGLEFFLWHEHAEDHGGMGQIGRMGLRHPEWFTRSREGQASHCRLSWGIEPAVEYRLAWVREVLEYEPDGVYFDFTKSVESTPGKGCTPHWDAKGVWNCTYDEPVVEAFKCQTGRDPFEIPNDDEEWVRFRAGYVTDFVRKIRQLQQSTYPTVTLGLFGCPKGRMGLAPDGKDHALAEPLFSFLEDHETWTREGLFDEFVSAYATHGVVTGPELIQATISDSRSRVHAPCEYLGTQLEVYSAKDEESIVSGVRAAAEADCRRIVFFEATPLQWNTTWHFAARAIDRFGA